MASVCGGDYRDWTAKGDTTERFTWPFPANADTFVCVWRTGQHDHLVLFYDT